VDKFQAILSKTNIGAAVR